jgi:hypothetical protein
MDVIGLECHYISEMESFVGYLKSQILKHPSSAPEAIRLVETRFQEITLTSLSCALIRIYDF